MMELDDLKQAWQKAPITKPTNTDIMELIHHKSYGPVAALKRNFKREIVLMMILPFCLILTNMDDVSKVFTSVMFWSYVAFCIGMIFTSYYNYRVVRKMEGMDGMVKTNLEQQITVLEARLKWNIVALRVVMIYFIILTEILPYFQHFRMLSLWHSFPLAARYGTYIGLLTFQYFASKKVSKRKYGEHIEYLRRLTGEMQ